jgi:hypothetical protein
MDKYGWIDELMADIVASTPERSPEDQRRMAAWIEYQIEELRSARG